jgi:4-amino-4-deoxy-L-arabinose transferase-like glycosyltransferase
VATPRPFARFFGGISDSGVTRFLESPITRGSLFALATLLFAIGNLPWQLDDYDQAKQAFTSFEMVERGHWFYQHTPNWWVATKPPLVGWISAGLFEVTRSWEIAWRAPSFLATLVLLVLVIRAASVYGTIAALVAGAALSFNLFVPRLASLVRTDLPLALVIFAIGWLVWKKIRTATRWTSRDKFLLFLLLSAGMLIKGPIVYAFLLPGLILFEWRRRKSGDSMRTAWAGWLPWLLSFLVFLLWVGGGILFVPEFTEHVVLREFAGRFSEGVHRAQPFYFYLPHLLHRFAPWSLLLIGLAVVVWKSKRDGSTGSRPAIAAETLWLVAWTLGGVAAMSLVPSKRIDRIFPIVPPLCLLLAVLVGRLRQSAKLRKIVDRSCAVAVVVAVIFTTGYTVRKIALALHQHRDAFAIFGRAVVQETAAHNWRYGVVGGEDEGMSLYVRQTEFLEPHQAVAGWNAEKFDALVLPDDEIGELIPQLHGEPRKVLTSGQGGRYRKRYFLLAR